MAIVKTELGPNSAMFTIGSGETQASVFAAMDQYITAHGWELWDAAPGTNIGAPGSNQGRVYRALQEGSTTVYKYVGIYFQTITQLAMKVFESWNPTTHVGVNEAFQVHGISNTSQYANLAWGVEGTALVLFVNKKWLAYRVRENTYNWWPVVGAFEIKKDFGEAESIPSVILMSGVSPHYASNPSAGVNFFACPRNSKGVVGNTNANSNTIATPFGALGINSSSYHVAVREICPTVIPNGTMTMVAAENRTATNYGIDKLRGRIMGIKMVYGSVYWNDMDKTQVATDSDFFQNPGSPMMDHHILQYTTNSTNPLNYHRFVIPV